MHHVRFIATEDQLRELVCNVIEASGLDRPAPYSFGVGQERGLCVGLMEWKMKPVGLIIIRTIDPNVFTLWHDDACDASCTKLRRKPWGARFTTGLDLVRSIPGIEVLEMMTTEAWWSSILTQSGTLHQRQQAATATPTLERWEIRGKGDDKHVDGTTT